MKKRKIARSVFAVFLSLVLLFNGIAPGLPFVSTAYAAEEENETTNHEHEFVYTSDGALITAECHSTTGDCDIANKKVTLTLNAPEKKTDTDNGSAEATLNEEEWQAFRKATGLERDAFTITYKKKDSTADEESATAPTVAGEYTATLTVKHGVEASSKASVDYTIASTTTTQSMKITFVLHEHDFTYTANGATITAECQSKDGDCDITGKKVILTLNAPEKMKDTDNGKAEATLNEEDWQTFMQATGLNETAFTITYKKKGSTADEESTTAPTVAGEYTATLTVKHGAEASSKASVDYTIVSAATTKSMKITLVIDGDGNDDEDGETTEGEVNTEESVTTTKSMKITLVIDGDGNDDEDGETTEGEVNTEESVTTTKSMKITLVIDDDEDGETTEREVNTEESVTTTKSMKIALVIDDDGNGDEEGETTEGEVNTEESATTTQSMKITLVIHEHEFDYTSEGAVITAECQSTAGDCNIEDKKAALTLKAPEKKIDTDSGNAEAAIVGVDDFNKATKLSVSSSQVQYYKKGTDVRLDAAPTEKGDYTAKLTVEGVTASVDYSIGTSNRISEMKISLTIAEADVKTAPTANTLIYNGTEQALVTAGTATGGIGEGNAKVQYQLGENATTAPAGIWRDTIPTQKDAGTYYVWYRAYAGENNVSAPAYVTVTIEKKSIAGAIVTLRNKEFAYDGSEKSVTVTGVKLADETQLTSENYDVSDTVKATANGTYTVKISGTGNYKDTVTTTWSIKTVQYKVTLNTNGGTIKEEAAISDYICGIGATLPTNATITKAGYIFGGWYESAEFIGNAVTEISSSDTGDKVFYAKWNEVETEHIWDDGTVTKSATCTEKGEKTYTCTMCNETRTEDIAATGHDLTKIGAKAATCLEAGNNEYYKCANCDKVFKDAEGNTETTVAAESTKPTGHDWDGGNVTKSATCTEKGEKTYICKNDESHSKKEEIEPTGHELTKIEAKAATCLEAGNNEYYKCANCDKVFKDAEGNTETTVADESTNPTGHDWDGGIVTISATCTEKGEKTYICKNDESHSKKEEIEPTGHELTKIEAKAATCLEAGNNEYYKCLNCDKVFKDAEGNTETNVAAETIEATGHEWGVGTVTRSATCTEKGERTYICKNDKGHIKQEDIEANGHAMTKIKAKAATCLEAGNNEYYICSDCDKVFKDAEGKTETTVTDEIIAASGHDWDEWTETIPATVDAAGVATRVCKNDAQHTEFRWITVDEISLGEEAVEADQLKEDNKDIIVQTGSVMDIENLTIDQLVDLLMQEETQKELVEKALSEDIGSLGVAVTVTDAEKINGRINLTDEQIISAVLTPQELINALSGNDDIKLELVIECIDEQSIEESIVYGIKEAANESEGLLYFNADLFKTVTKKTDSGDQTTTMQVTELHEGLWITIDIPEAIRAEGRTYRMIRTHKNETTGNMEVDELSDLDQEPYAYTIAIDKLCTMAFAWVSTAPVELQTIEAPETTEEMIEIAINAGLKISQTGSKINIKWGKVKEADGYEVYVAYCDKKFGKAVKTISKNSTTSFKVTKLNGKKINLTKNFKVYVAAYKMVDGKKVRLAKSITGHVVGRKNTRYSNAKKITLSKSKFTVKVGKTAAIKAKTVLVDKTKKKLSNAHAAEFRYASSNKNVATVNKNGKIKGVSAGTCTIYVYARNGYARKVSVTVK